MSTQPLPSPVVPASLAARRPRVALIGVTGYGVVYVHLVRETLAARAIELVAAVVVNRDDPLAAAIADEFERAGARIHPDADAFFAAERGRVDLCMIPVGIAWHARLSIAALRAGMNVLVEKPLAGSLADALAIQAAEAETGRFVALGFQDIYAPENRWIKSRLLAGAIGRVEEIHMLGLWPRPRSYFTRNGWAGRARADGADVLDSPVNNAFAHFFNLALFFAGSASGDSARLNLDSAELFRAHAIEMFDTAIVRGRTREGVRLWFGVSHAAGVNREPVIVIRGSCGSIEWNHERDFVVTDSAGRRETRPLPSADQTRRLMLDAALARLSDPSGFICDTAIAAAHTRLVEDLRRAGPVLDFPDDAVSWRDDTPTVRGLADEMTGTLESGAPAGAELSVAP